MGQLVFALSSRLLILFTPNMYSSWVLVLRFLAVIGSPPVYFLMDP